MAEFYVSPDGDDSGSGTFSHPFGTLDHARIAARQCSGPVVVNLRAGRHVLTSALEFTAEDSGDDGHRVVYQAYGYGTADQEEAVLSGGLAITEWTQRNGVWLAEVGELDTRQLYVDASHAERAGIDGLPGTPSSTGTGYRADTADPLHWSNPAGVEFVYRGVYPWTEARCGVASVARDGESAVITMRQPAFGWAVALYNSTWDGQVMAGPGLPSRVENDPSFLTEPGTFVLDRSCQGRHLLHYLPRAGEHPARTRVVAPVAQTLLHANGSRDMSFRGITFADATWLRPGEDGGFLHYHGTGYYDGGRIERVAVDEGGESWVTVPGDVANIPACVALRDTHGVRFEGCRFTRLGATALGATGGTWLTVHRCTFDYLAADAIAVLAGRDALIEDNVVRHVGLDYSGSPGITLLNPVDATVAHNRISKVPHCGIVAGPGRGTRILNNLIADSMTVLADGGGIYLAGEQGSSHQDGAMISGNVVTDTHTPYNFAIYTDYGASWVTVERNVVQRADNSAVLLVNPPLREVVYRDNYWDLDPYGSDAVPAGVTFQGNTTLTDDAALAAATVSIRDGAGPRTAGR